MAISIRNRIEDLKGSFSRLSPRERMALGGLALSVVLGTMIIVGYMIFMGLEEIEERNAAIRTALKDLQRHGKDYLAQRRRITALEVRMNRTPLELNSFVEEKAKAVGISISESGELTPVEGERYTQRGLEIKLRRVKIDELAKLLKALENSPHIVQITSLNVSTRWNDHENLDVEMVVSTYEPRKEGPPPEERGKEPRRKRGRS